LRGAMEKPLHGLHVDNEISGLARISQTSTGWIDATPGICLMDMSRTVLSERVASSRCGTLRLDERSTKEHDDDRFR